MNSFPDTWPEDRLSGWDAALAADDDGYRRAYPGPPPPGPVHTVYVPVPGFDADTVGAWRRSALQSIKDHAGPWESTLTWLVQDTDQGRPGIADDRALLASRTLAKLLADPIEDLRIDFEDGFRAHRGTADDDAEEDGHARRAGLAVVEMTAEPRLLPANWGLRIRSLAPETRRRGLRTLRLFLGTVLDSVELPSGFVVTLPKVTSREQVSVFVEVLELVETEFGVPPGSLRFEIQVETPQTVLGADGRIPVAEMIHAADGRVSGLHFGTYDYSASLGILGKYQNLRHPVADFAKSLMQLAAAETGVRVSDGSDNKLPIGDVDDTVAERWRTHAEGVQRALRSGIYQGWDLHPAQLPTRFAATFAFFRAGFADAARRLGDYHRQQSGGGVLDEPATAFALARHLAAALHCDAIGADELAAAGDIGPAVVSRYLVRGAPPGAPVLETGALTLPTAGPAE